jgi:hypothetical protein
MRLLPTLSAVAAALVLATAVEAAPKAGKKGKKSRPITGVVVAVQKDKDADSGTITVQVHHKKKKGAVAAAAAAQEKTFKVTNATRFEKVSGKKGQQQTHSTTFQHVHKGEHVVILHQGDTAQEVRIQAKGKGKAKGRKAVKL